MKIVISKEYTKIPGGRFENEGEFSGENFRKTILKPKYVESLSKREKLMIDMDGCYGFASSFLEEAFGGLARELKNISIMNNISIISNDEPDLSERIARYVLSALNKR